MQHDFSCEYRGSKRFSVIDRENGTIELRRILCAFKLMAKKTEETIIFEPNKKEIKRVR